MRILHVTDTYAPTLGGIEVMVHDLAARQAAAGHDVTVLTRTALPPVPASQVSGSGGVVVRRDRDATRGLVAGADQVHSHVSAISPLALRAAEVAAGQRIPVVATVHSMWGSAWPLFRAMGRARGWDELPIQWTAVSEAASATVRRALGDRPVLVLPNAVDIAAWAPTRRAADGAGPGPALDAVAPAHRGLGSPSVTIVGVMRMARRKRPLQLLAVLRRMRAALPAGVQVRVVLVGDGPLLEQVRGRISAWGMEGWVEAPGALSHDVIRVLYRDAQVFVAPATLESFGIAALEARASGLAVVARAGTGVADFVTDGVDGLLAGSDAEMAGLLARLCADTAALRRMRVHNSVTPPDFDWSHVLWRTDYAYEASAKLAARGLQPSGSTDEQLGEGRRQAGRRSVR